MPPHPRRVRRFAAAEPAGGRLRRSKLGGVTTVRRGHDTDGGGPHPPRLRPPEHRVSPRAIAHWAIESLLLWGLAFGLALGVAAWAGDADWDGMPGWLSGRVGWLPYIIGAAGLLMVTVAPVWRYRVHRWEVTDDAVYALTGWLVREWRVTPISRVQTVDAVQGPAEQLLGLSTLRVTTASSRGAVNIGGLDKRVAADIAERLAEITQSTAGDAT